LQNATPVTLGATWTEPASGLTTGAAAPLTGCVPDGAEAIGNVQSLARSLTNSAGQVVAADAYFNLSGVSYSTTPRLGTVNVNYYETTDGYDSRGRLERVQSPTGTISRTVFDGLSRVAGIWIGTNDTGATDSNPAGSGPPNNMVKLRQNAYDTYTV